MKRKRPIPTDLQVGTLLAQRGFPLTPKETEKLSHAEKGYCGEVDFDNWLLEDLPENWYVLQDLWLDAMDSTLQIDCLIITPKEILLFEVKNYTGSYFLEGDRLLTESQYEIKNPHIQLKRTETLLRQLLVAQFGKATPPIISYVCFINSGFYLYNAPPQSTYFLFHNLLTSFKQRVINQNPTFNKYKKIGEFLIKKDLDLISRRGIFKPIFEYTEAQLAKGIVCKNCNELIIPSYTRSRMLTCTHCDEKEPWSTAVLRNTEAYSTLFPDTPITSRRIAGWCGLQDPRPIRRIFNKHYIKHKNGRSTYYKK